MIRSVGAELRKLIRRPAVVVGLLLLLLAIVMLEYVGPAVRYSDHAAQQLYPQWFTDQVLNVFFLGGIMVALLMGTLTVGSEYGWGALGAAYVMGAGRIRQLACQLVAAVLVLAAILVLCTIAAALASLAIATADHARIAWPAAGAIVKALGAAFLILVCYLAGGVALAHLFRSPTVAIGVGLTYALVFELIFVNYFGRLLGRVDLRQVVPGNSGSSLISWVQVPPPHAPPPVGAGHAIVVLGLWTLSAVAVSTVLVLRRDVA